MFGASGEAQDVEGREKIRSGEASVGQFPMRQVTQSSRGGVTDWFTSAPMFRWTSKAHQRGERNIQEGDGITPSLRKGDQLCEEPCFMAPGRPLRGASRPDDY